MSGEESTQDESWIQESDDVLIEEEPQEQRPESEDLARPPSKSYFCLHLTLLLWKNFKLFSRNLKLTMFQIVTPIFFCLLIVYLQWLADGYTTLSRPNPSNEIGPMKKCYGKGCTTVGYGIIGDSINPASKEYDWIHHVMKYVAHNNGFKFGEDVRLLSLGEAKDFSNYILKNQNKTLYGVLFCTRDWKVGNVSIPCRFEKNDYDLRVYSLYFNFSLEPDFFLKHPITPGPTDPALLRLKLSIDNGIMEHYAQQNYMEPPSISAIMSNYPMPADRFLTGFSLISVAGPFYFFFTPMVTFMIILVEIAKEKEQKLRHGLSVMGLKSSSFWISWLITGFAFAAIATVVLMITGALCMFEFFLNTPIPVCFMLFFIFSLAMIMFAFLLSTLINTQKIAYTLSFLFLLIGVVLQALLSNTLMVYMLFYPEDIQPWNLVVRFIFSLYPPYSFSKVFGDIARITTSHYVPEEFRWIAGRKFEWADLFKENSGTLTLGIKYRSPGPINGLGTLMINALVFGIFAWYFDHVLASNRGIADHPLFFLTRKYWCSRGRQQPIEGLIEERKVMEPETEVDARRGTADLERDKVVELEKIRSNQDGIRIIGIDKCFRQGLCGRKSVHALKKIYIDISRGELIALLGHNGAGKSTLINILTGILGNSGGTAKVCGYDISENINEIQKLIGLVPQFDILWGEMTAREHLQMFSKLKGVPADQIDAMIKEKLAEVNLSHVENSTVRTFSGGMKRRLSVAIGSIGNPRIIIMDEPTTGMDPVNRRKIWKLIRELKKNRVFILTTHQMEEADILADRVGIIVDGEIRCIGTPLFLKNHYGEGYRLGLVTEPSKVAEVESLVHLLVPSAKLLDESAGSMVYSVSMSDTDSLKPIFKLMEGSERLEEGDMETREGYAQLRRLVKDVGLSNSTLEEVFMKVTSKKERKNLQETLAAAAALES